MKPDTQTAMRELIQQVRSSIPFDTPAADLCSDTCAGCSRKLLDYLEMELENWESRLDQGEIPNFGDINKIARSSKKIYNALKKNGLIN